MPKSTESKKKKLQNNLSRRWLLLTIFLLLFGGIGTYLVLFSSAATSCSTSNICVIYSKSFSAASDHFLTIDDAEAGNYSLDGPAFYAQNSEANGASKIYRLWNGGISAHIYTIDSNYKNNLVAAGWTDETGSNSPAFYAFWNQVPNSSAVYQLISPDGSDYVYSLDNTEINSLKAAGWSAAPAFWAYYTNPTPAAPTNASPPTGAIAHIGCDYISGWSADPDNYNVSNQVHIYVDNVLYAYGVTDQAAQINVPGSNHGFWWNLPTSPSSLKAAGPHNVVVWGIDYNTAGQYTGGAKNAIIGQASYTCASTTTSTTTTMTTNKSAPNGLVDYSGCNAISGWAFDPDTNPATSKSNDVHIIIGTETFNIGPTTAASPDINDAYGITGTHRFVFAVPDKYKTIDSPLQVYSIDFNSAGTYVPNSSMSVRILNTTLKCAPVAPTILPTTSNLKTAVGTVDLADCNVVSGWSYDEDNKGGPTDIHISINGVVHNTGPTTGLRKDINDAYGLTGNHGYSFTIPNSDKINAKNSYNVKAYAINIDKYGYPGGVNTLMWSGQYTCNDTGAKVGATTTSTQTPSGTENKLTPIGKIDSNNCSTLSGWARDPDTAEGIKVHVMIDGGKAVEYAADKFRADVGNHAFVMDVGANFMDGKQHFADVYGLDYDNAGKYIGLNNNIIGSASWNCTSDGKPVTVKTGLVNGLCPGAGPNLQSGAKGEEVTQVQACLSKLGISTTDDGSFGPKTENSIKLFQADYGRFVACALQSEFNYAAIVTGKVTAQTYAMFKTADTANWRLVNSNAVTDTRSSCSGATPVTGFIPDFIPDDTSGGGVTGTVAPGTPTDPASGLNQKQTCVVHYESLVNPLGENGIRLDRDEKIASLETYYGCREKGALQQGAYDTYVADNSAAARSGSTNFGLNRLTYYIDWGSGSANSTIWRIDTTKGAQLYASIRQAVADNEKRDCTLWIHNSYISAATQYDSVLIGSYTKQQCIDIANSVEVYQVNLSDSLYYSLSVIKDGSRSGIATFSSPTQTPDHIDWNGGAGNPNGLEVKDLKA